MNAILENFRKHKDAHLAEYGSFNEERLTGAHETAKANEEISSLAHKLQQQVDSFKL